MEPLEREVITKVSFDTESLDKAQEKADKLKATLLEVSMPRARGGDPRIAMTVLADFMYAPHARG